MSLYKAYQLQGGNEKWVTCHADANFEEIKPSFITVLACDTLLDKDSPKGMVEAAKYFGPLYFDLDSSDLSESIAGTQDLWVKLQGYGLQETDVEIFCSGKKGLHVLVQPVTFMEKLLPVNKLPAVYKEIAFHLATDTLDFAVYSGRRGRMLRTHYNQRDNDNYKVQISVAELAALTPASYAQLCSAPRPLLVTAPVFRPQLAILYESIRQRIAALKKVRTKPVSADTLRRHLPIVQKLMAGEGVKDGIGFNKIAIQLAIYAHEAKLSEDQLVEQCQGLIKDHSGDGYRYNTPFKREHELRRMHAYLDESSGYDYAIGPIQAMLEPVESEEEEGEETYVEEDNSGIFTKGANYFAATEQGDRHILNCRFKDTVALLNPQDENISLLKTKLVVGDRSYDIKLERDAFANNSALHRAISDKGAAFTGTDAHARYIYTIMLKEIKNKETKEVTYATTSEGLDLLCMPRSVIVEARTPFMVWADGHSVQVPASLVAKGLKVELAPDPGPEPILKTDLAMAPIWPVWLSQAENNRDKMYNMLEGLLQCQESVSLAKIIGWCCATFFTQLFRRVYSQFPSLHIAGPAGTGKSRMMESMMRMFYYNELPQIQSASSSTFALTSAMAGSASIPVVIDEYKPHSMGPQKVEEMRSFFRSSYNGHSVSRGGGNRNTSNFRGLNSVVLSGPIVFMAEAMETEVAVLHRTVLVTLRRQPGKMNMRTKPNWDKFQNNLKAMPIIGHAIAADIINNYTLDSFTENFQPLLDEAMRKLTSQVTDTEENCDAQTLSLKSKMNERIVFNHAVTEFGLRVFGTTVEKFFGPEDAAPLLELIDKMTVDVYNPAELAKLTDNSVPEYIKVLIMFSDMSRFPEDSPSCLVNGADFEVADMGGKPTIAIVGRLAYNKYRMHCRAINVVPLFMNDSSFVQAMKDSPMHMGNGTGTKAVKQETLILDYDAMIRQGVYGFHRK